MPVTETYRLMRLLEDLRGSPSTRRDGSCIAHLLRAGYSPEAIEDGIRGLAAARDGTLVLPEGALGWLHRGQEFGAQILIYRDHTSGRRVIDLAGDAWRRGRVSEGRGGTADVASILRNLGAI